MRIPFQKYVEDSERNLVIHNIMDEDKIMSKIKTTDIVFFDDCTYDQFRFISDNIGYLSRNAVVIGFSTDLYRKNDDVPLTGMTTKQLHDGLHEGNNDFKRGFMSISEIKTLKNVENVYIALHGHDHLFLEDKNPYERSVAFREELRKSMKFLETVEISTNIFVYPYDFSDCLSDNLLRENGFYHVYPSKERRRIYIEDLIL